MIPFFSVVIPIYKVEKYLRECVDSVLKQTFKDIEIILVDDGSPDECPRICDEYGARYDNIKVIHKKNGGLSSARNAGLNVTTGTYTVFLDSDDFYIHDDFFEKAHTKLIEKDVDILCFARVKYYDVDGIFSDKIRFFDKEINEAQSYGDLSMRDELEANASLKFIKTHVLKDNDLYFKEGLLSEDVEWAFRLYPALTSGAVLNYPNYAYRLREGSITHTITKKNIDHVFFSIKTYSDSIMKTSIDERLKKGLMNYVAYQYFIVIALVEMFLSGKEKKEYFKELKKYKWICSFAISSKTKKAATVVKLLGIRVGAYILAKYLKIKK